MDIELMNYKEMLQQIADSSSGMLDLDIEIIDRHLVRVAGSGVLKEMNGQGVIAGGVVENILHKTRGMRFVVENPGYSPLCENCEFAGEKCPYKVAVYSSIFYEGELLGVIGLVTFGVQEHSYLTQSPDELLDFAAEMAELIRLKIAEIERGGHKQGVGVFGFVLNGLDRGVIILKDDYTIEYVNTFVSERLGISLPAVRGRKLTDVFPTIDLSQQKHGEYHKIAINGIAYIYNIHEYLQEYGLRQLVVNIIRKKSNESTTEQKPLTNTIHDIIGTSKSFTEFKNKVLKIAEVDSTVLLTGESGTGKELFARAIHNHSKRLGRPFVVINCSTIPETLIESVLFGYEKGAFTGAINTGRDGKFVSAENGTVFLDEIEAIPLYVQPKLLRVLENRTIERVGGVREIPVNIRVIAASNEDLGEKVAKGSFRFDLYQRLNVIPLVIPPLRERGSDILLLAQHFIDVYHYKLGNDIIGLDEEVSRLFLNYEWPGNVREIKNVIEFAVIVENSKYITMSSLPDHLKSVKKVHNDFVTLAELERDYIVSALEHFGWHDDGKTMAAKKLGISRSTIYRKIKEYNIHP